MNTTLVFTCLCASMNLLHLGVFILKQPSGHSLLYERVHKQCIAVRQADHSEAATVLSNDNSTQFLTSNHSLAILHAYTRFDHMSCTRPALLSCV